MFATNSVIRSRLLANSTTARVPSPVARAVDNASLRIIMIWSVTDYIKRHFARKLTQRSADSKKIRDVSESQHTVIIGSFGDAVKTGEAH
mgnify:CR=1 FL=1